MHHYIALLRGINLGKRRIKMEELRVLFEQLKFRDVTTFIASGNVVFSSPSADAAALEARIEKHLAKSLGYEVDTYLRTRAEMAATAARRPFPAADVETPYHAIYVSFPKEAMEPELTRKFTACRTETDAFAVSGREYFWLCRVKSSESTVWTRPEVRALKLPSATMRNATTVGKLAALYPVPAT